MTSQIQPAGTSWIKDSRQFKTSSLTPRINKTIVPAAHATGARYGRDSPN
jgi:hypothetical protein